MPALGATGLAVVAVSVVIAIQFKWHHRTHSSTTKFAEVPENYFLNNQNLAIYTKNWTADKPKARIFVVHGMGEHIARYEWFASNLVKEGYEVYGMDHQGHGLSEGDRCFVEDFDHFVDDVSTFVSKVMKDKNDNLPQFLFGHSMGGTISLHVAHSHPEFFKGVILSGPFFLPAQDIGTVQKWLMGTFSSYLPKAPIPQRIPPAHVSRSSETVHKYATDPLVLSDPPLVRTVHELFETGQNLLEPQFTSTFHLPLLIVHGEEDLLADVKGSRLFCERAQSEDKTCKTYPKFYHEVLNEPEKEHVLQDILDWIKKHID
jgi:acylglycerol lipase